MSIVSRPVLIGALIAFSSAFAATWALVPYVPPLYALLAETL